MVVIDEGRGIHPDEVKSIFGMFTQSRQGLARRSKEDIAEAARILAIGW